MNKEDLSRFGIEEIIQYTLEHYQVYFVKLIILFQAYDRIGMEKEDILAEFVLFLLERGAVPLYNFEGKSSYRAYVIILFRNWLKRFLTTNELKLSREIQAEYNIFRERDNGGMQGLGINHSMVEEEILEREKANRMNYVVFALRECLLKLDSKWSKYLFFIFSDKIRISDIAIVEKIKLRTAYNRFYSILKKLRECLNNKGIHEEDL